MVLIKKKKKKKERKKLKGEGGKGRIKSRNLRAKDTVLLLISRFIGTSYVPRFETVPRSRALNAYLLIECQERQRS